ncbi:MAG: DUF4349 domain-containing protein [Eubacteriales bacterium]|nr:DUF4349 domain-containing protein [Eubacteriales bacterium]
MKKRIIALLMIAALLLSSAACAASRKDSDNGYFAAAEAPAAPAPMAEAPAAEEFSYDSAEAETTAAKGDWGESGTQSAAEAQNNYGGHKIIKNAELGLQTRDFDAVLDTINQKISEMGGFVASSNISGKEPEKYGESGRYAYISVRIPQENMEAFLESAKDLATVDYENTSGEDVTYAYYDTESRLKIYQTQRERILELLAQADSIESVIALETELSRITYEIESLTSDLKRWDDLVAFSTVNININEIPPVSAVADDDSFGTRVSEGLMNTLSGIGVFFENLAIYLIIILPVLVLIGAIVWIIIAIVRANRRKKGLLPPKHKKGAAVAVKESEQPEKKE